MNYIIIIGLVLIGIMAISLLTGRNKISQEKSPTESIASTLNNKVQRALKDIANGLRTPEVLKEEINDAFITYEKAINSNYGNYLTGLIETRDAHEENIKSLENSYNSMVSKAKQYKNSGDETAVKNFASRALQLKDKIEKSKKSKQECIDQIDAAKVNKELAEADCINYRAEVLSLMTNPNMMKSLDTYQLDGLVSEFSSMQKKAEQKAEVDLIMKPEKEITNISDESLNEFISGL